VIDAAARLTRIFTGIADYAYAPGLTSAKLVRTRAAFLPASRSRTRDDCGVECRDDITEWTGTEFR
jgi:hypothetical protein